MRGSEISPGDAEIALSPRAASFFISIEKYVLPLVYAFLAWQRFQVVEFQFRSWRALGQRTEMVSSLRGLHFAELTKHVLLFLLMSFTALTLLFNRAPTRLPDKLKHVVAPLAAS